VNEVATVKETQSTTTVKEKKKRFVLAKFGSSRKQRRKSTNVG
jgi:hypothetical protein